MEKFIYADNAATTKISQCVLDAMMSYMTSEYGNASSLHTLGQNNRQVLENSRQTVADAIGAKFANEIIFTSGGTEADNMALKGFMLGKSCKGKHIITTKIEHPAILDTCKFLEKQGFSVTYLDVDKDGLVTAQDVENAITEDTALVSIMTANNEIGTIMPIKEIGALCRERKIIFHTDAVQAIGHIEMNVQDMNIDMLSLSGHKIHGPKGMGVLYCRRGLHLEPLIHGGGQEKNKRSGTENVAGIVGISTAIKDATDNMTVRMAYVKNLRDMLLDGLSKIPYTHFTGHKENRLPGTASIVFEAIEGEGLLLLLDMNGICASTGSACATGSLDPSHVLMSIGLPHEIAHGSLRLTLSHENTAEEIEFIVEKVSQAVARLREMSPVWETMMKNNK